MNFKSYLIEQESLAESAELIKKIAELSNIVRDLNIKEFLKTLTKCNSFLSITTARMTLTNMQKQRNDLLIELEDHTKDVLKLKKTIESSYFEKIVKLCYDLIDDVRVHFDNEQNRYNKTVRNKS